MKKIQEKDLIKLLVEGKSCPEIAKIYEVNKQVIQRKVKKLTLPEDLYIKARPSLKPLTQIELDVLIGGLLGDTWLGYTKNSKNVAGSFTHKLEHEQYTTFKYNLLKRLCAKPTIHNKTDKRTNRVYQQSFCKISTNPILNPIVEAFYKEGKKVVNKEFIMQLTPLAIAIWFMDDGTKTVSGYCLATDCFTYEDKLILGKLLEKYNIKYSIPNISKYMYVKAESKNDFTNLIKKFFPECMKYKLHNCHL